ncbi:MAG: hypothetical protein HQL26_03140 [Candidatus Omnitrophica bacterium]|nr:hypothetical protein [Candidatus Omnitrophota bacterium]
MSIQNVGLAPVTTIDSLGNIQTLGDITTVGKIYINTTKIFLYGAGNPNGNVVGNAGDLCVNPTTGAMYIKDTTAGNTGWRMVIQETATQTMDNKTLNLAVLNSPTINGTVGGTAILDDIDLTGNDANRVPTQHAVKQYVDSHAATAVSSIDSLYKMHDASISVTTGGTSGSVLMYDGSVSKWKNQYLQGDLTVVDASGTTYIRTNRLGHGLTGGNVTV